MFNASRMELARRRRGFSKTRLSQESGFAVRSITAWENGELDPSDSAVSKLAEALGFPVDFFSGADIELPPPEAVSFRALKSITATQRDSALGACTIAFELAQWLSERFVLPPCNIPDLSDTSPETAAEVLRAEWGLGQRPISNLVHLLELKGVRVFSLAEECLSVDAFSLWRDDVPFVFLNTMKSAERSRIDAAHELFHLVKHRFVHEKGPTCEKEAQQFAGAFLMPRSSILASHNRVPSVPRLIEMKKVWNVAVTALVYRLHEVGVISDWQYRTLFIELSARGFRNSEPDPSDRELSAIFAKALELLKAERRDVRSIAADLQVYPDEVNNLIFKLGIIPVDGKLDPGAGARSRCNPDLRVVT